MKIYKIELAQPWGKVIVAAPNFDVATEVIKNDQYLQHCISDNETIEFLINDGFLEPEKVGEFEYEIVEGLEVSGTPKVISFNSYY